MTVQVDIPVGEHIALFDGWTPGSRGRSLKWSGFIKSSFANSWGSRGSVQLLLLSDFHVLQHCKLSELFWISERVSVKEEVEGLSQLWPWACSSCACPWLGMLQYLPLEQPRGSVLNHQRCDSLPLPACPTRSLVVQGGGNPNTVIPCVETRPAPSSAKDSWTLDHKGLAWKGPSKIT